MNEAKILLRESENAVLLVCDFYETKQIPVEMTTEKNNLSLFPVANIPLIEYILSSLLKQNLKNIIVTGKCIERIKEVVQGMNIFNCMKIIFMEIEGNNLGDVLRIMKDNDLDVKDLLIMYANHYTNYDLNSIFIKHRLNNFLMTLFLHKGNSNSKINHFYGFKKDQIVFYEKCINGKYNIQHIKDSLETNKTVNFHFNLSSPTIGVISGDVLRVFGENFDYATLGDLLEGLLAFNPFNHQIGFIKEEENGIVCYCGDGSYAEIDGSQVGLDQRDNSPIQLNPTQPSPNIALNIQPVPIQSSPALNPTIPTLNHTPLNTNPNSLSNWNLLRLSLSNWYSREIITLLDYFIFNEDVKKGSFVNISDYPRKVDGELKKLSFYQGNYFYDLFLFMDNNVIVNNTVLGTKNRLNNDSKLENCFVGDGCTINGSISKCIVWDDIHINQDLDGYIVFSKEHKIPFTHLEIEMDLEEEVIDTTNFFDDLVGYLKSCLDSVRKDKIQIEEVIKQVNMLRIIWNASDLDLIEAFSVFLTDIVSPEDVEDSAINGSFFFPILENTVNTPKKQQELLILIWNQMKDLDLDFKKNVFCIYAYQLFEDGVISRSVYKEYNMLVVKNLL